MRAVRFQLSEEAKACEAKGATRFRRPRLVVRTSRHEHNRRMHALNGNGVAALAPTRSPFATPRRQRNRLAHAQNGNTAAGGGAGFGMLPLPDTSAPHALHGFTLIGMRLVDERSDCFHLNHINH